jgi:hypothetical protein
MPMPLQETLDLLEGKYGRPKPPKIKDPWNMILWENVAYMANDERREEAFQSPRTQSHPLCCNAS